MNMDLIIQGSINILFGIAIILLGYALSNAVSWILRKIFDRTEFDPMLETWVTAAAQVGILLFAIIAGFNQMGVETTSVHALLVGLGVAIGGFMSGALGDAAAGVMILVLKPYRVGDRVSVAGGIEGTVTGLSLFRTNLETPDHRSLSVPNNHVTNNTIENWRGDKRLDIVVGVNYGEEQTAEAVFTQIIDECVFKLVGSAYPHTAVIDGNTAHGVNYRLMVYVKPQGYYTAKFWINQQVNQRFREAGITISRDMLEIFLPDGVETAH